MFSATVFGDENVLSIALNGSMNWPWKVASTTKVRVWETKSMRPTFRRLGNVNHLKEAEPPSDGGIMPKTFGRRLFWDGGLRLGGG